MIMQSESHLSEARHPSQLLENPCLVEVGLGVCRRGRCTIWLRRSLVRLGPNVYDKDPSKNDQAGVVADLPESGASQLASYWSGYGVAINVSGHETIDMGCLPVLELFDFEMRL